MPIRLHGSSGSGQSLSHGDGPGSSRPRRIPAPQKRCTRARSGWQVTAADTGGHRATGTPSARSARQQRIQCPDHHSAAHMAPPPSRPDTTGGRREGHPPSTRSGRLSVQPRSTVTARFRAQPHTTHWTSATRGDGSPPLTDAAQRVGLSAVCPVGSGESRFAGGADRSARSALTRVVGAPVAWAMSPSVVERSARAVTAARRAVV